MLQFLTERKCTRAHTTFVRVVSFFPIFFGLFLTTATAQTSLGDWAWYGGGTATAPVYGTQYEFAADNWPGARQDNASWGDTSGRAWIFGGFENSAVGQNGNDFWVFDPTQGAHGEWAWIGGTATTSTPGVYGTKYQFATDNWPGSRYGASTWSDKSGRLWLFGGYGETGLPGYEAFDALNDLWVFDPGMGTHGEWAWMGGSDDQCTPKCGHPSTYGTEYQFDADNTPGSREHATSWIDAHGRLWLLGGERVYPDDGAATFNELWVFDPGQGAHGEWAWMGGTPNSTTAGVYGTEYQFAATNFPGSRDTGSTWLDENGKVWLFGGWGFDVNGNAGPLNDLWAFDPSQGAHGEWAWMGGSNTLATWTDGRGETYWIPVPGTYGSKYQFAPANIPGGRMEISAHWLDRDGRFWLFGGYGAGAYGNEGPLNDLWVFDPGKGSHGEWAWMSGNSGLICAYNGCKAYPSVYGIEYQLSSTSDPAGRYYPNAFWSDAAGDLWLFAGGGTYSLTDLWRFHLLHSPQSIAFDPIPQPVTYGQMIDLSATATSGLPVTFHVWNGPATLSGTDNATLNTTGANASVVAGATQSGNLFYTAAPTAKQSFWVYKAPLNITADNKTMLYGAAVPALTWTPTGFVNGDSAGTAFTGAPQVKTGVTSKWAPGSYPILVSLGTLTSTNYKFALHAGTITVQPLGTVATPTFTPAAGTYSGTQTVHLNDTNAPVTYYYTTDGSTPSSTHGTKYIGPFAVSTSQTLKAIATKPGYTPSAVASVSYTIQ